MKKLFFGDCLDVLKELEKQHPDGFIDLIYIDPPFNSKRNYNVFYESVDMSDTKAQKEAFADTWSNISYFDSLNEILDTVRDKNLYTFLKTIEQISDSQSVVSYLTTMAIRIYYMKNALKDTGSFYLHCDPTMSHYLKIVCDFIFGKKNFRNEIVWCYRGAGYPKKDFGKRHDIIFRYSKSINYKFNLDNIREPYAEATVNRFQHYIGNVRNGKDFGSQKLHPLGKQPDDWWQIQPIAPSAKERLGYPTQKPESLLERIILASTNENDLVADFFCGCGTTIAVANKLNRNWIGVDISHLAIRLILKRLTDPYEEEQKLKIRSGIEIDGFPKDIDSARELAHTEYKGRLKFEEWIIEVMLGGIANEKKNIEGYDGYISFPKSEKDKGIILIEVKSGNVTLPQFQHFINTVKKQNSDMGVFLCFGKEITKNMLSKAKEEGNFMGFSKVDRIQILSVEDLLAGNGIKFPGFVENNTFKKNYIRSDNGVKLQDKIF